MRDVSGTDHFGPGDVEYSLTVTDQLNEAKALIRQAYELAR
jgi:predicted transport protein